MKVTQAELEHIAIQQYGIVPPFVKQLSSVSTSVAYHYLIGLSLMKEGTFSLIGQNVIQLKISVLNQCESCIKGHSFLLKSMGMADADIISIREGLLTSDSKTNRLVDLTQTVFLAGKTGFTREHIDKLQGIRATKTEVYEVISLIASKTISNYVNNFNAVAKSGATV
jgi:AhpD family alkylhydroperoxidase